MQRKSLFSLFLAMTLGLGAAVLAQNWLKSRVAAVEAQKGSGASVVVAATEIPFGERIRPENLKTVSWPRDSVPDGHVSNVADLVGKSVTQKVYAGEPVLQSRATQAAGGSSLAMQIEPHHRAVAVRVNDVIGVAGFLLPGNRVDVLATRMLDTRRARTQTIIHNAKVLAVDQTVQPEKDKPVVVRAVTLEVDPREAEQLVQAVEEGTVQLALRNPEDMQVVEQAVEAETPPAPVVAVAPAPAPAPAPARKPVARAPSEPPVTVIRQTQVGETKPQF